VNTVVKVNQAAAAATATRSDTLDLLRLALPNIGMTISRMLMGFIDFAMVSQLGTAAQAAVSPSTLLLFTIGCLGIGMAQGVQTFVSQAEGRGEPQRSGAYIWQTAYIALLAGLLSAPIAIATAGWFPVIGAFGRHPLDVQAMEIGFLSWALWSIAPMTACGGLECFYNGIRRPMIGLVGALAALATIWLGNWVLIFGHLGFPAMGIAGSGAATLLAWCVRLGVLIVPLSWSSIDRRYGIWRSYRPNLEKLRDIVRVGGPIALQWLVDIGAWLVFLQLMMPPYGKIAMAGANLAIQYMHLSFMPAIGIGVALTTQVGNAVGAGRPDEAVQRVIIARRIIVGYMGLMAVVLVLFGAPLSGLLCFESDAGLRSEVIAASAAMLIWVALFQVSDALCIVYSFASRGAGDTRVPALLFAVCCWGIFVAGGYATVWLAPQWGAHGPWSMCTLYIIVLSVLLWRRFHSGAWRSIRLFDSAAPAGAHAAALDPESAEALSDSDVIRPAAGGGSN
jgi:MATE family multidrug resistance protein